MAGSGPERATGAGLWRLIVPLLLMAAIFVESSFQLSVDLSHQKDKLVHGAAFAVLAFTWYWALLPRRWSVLITAVASFAIASLYGASDEIHQNFSGRDPDVLDALADAAGAAVAVLVASAWFSKSRSGA